MPQMINIDKNTCLLAHRRNIRNNWLSLIYLIYPRQIHVIHMRNIRNNRVALVMQMSLTGLSQKNIFVSLIGHSCQIRRIPHIYEVSAMVICLYICLTWIYLLSHRQGITPIFVRSIWVSAKHIMFECFFSAIFRKSLSTDDLGHLYSFEKFVENLSLLWKILVKCKS